MANGSFFFQTGSVLDPTLLFKQLARVFNLPTPLVAFAVSLLPPRHTGDYKMASEALPQSPNVLPPQTLNLQFLGGTLAPSQSWPLRRPSATSLRRGRSPITPPATPTRSSSSTPRATTSTTPSSVSSRNRLSPLPGLRRTHLPPPPPPSTPIRQPICPILMPPTPRRRRRRLSQLATLLPPGWLG